MSAQHTPGPWVAHFEEAYYVTGPDLGRVAMMMNLKGAHGLGGRRSGDKSAANCRLIAAAPDLLAALRIAVSVIQEDRKALVECHANPSTHRIPSGDHAALGALREYDTALSVARAAIAKATGGAQ